MDGSGLRGAGTPGAEDAAGPRGTTALDRFSQDLTAKAASGEMDPILGRDEEIRQIIDVLMRRRQNNPILTGEAGVGKTAVVEGFAQRIAAGDVPPPLRGVKLCVLDIGLMQAGASMKGEFEQRLRAVIDEVQNSPTPIILFIDEAHTLIGAGGPAGTGDAANLLKPALARGTLRTIAATTWLEYQKYFEKDPALTRRFQPIQIGEPDVATCCDMLRGILKPMEKHHKVRISDAAIVAAVNLSHRYIPARQLPDKAVSLLDTASARVAISQSATPAMIEDARVAIAARETEKSALVSDGDLGTAADERLGEIDGEIVALKEKLAALADRMGCRAEAGHRDPQPARHPGAEAGGREAPTRAVLGRHARPDPRKVRAARGARSGEAHDLCACGRAGGRRGGVRLDRHSGRPHGEGRDRDRSRPRGHSQSPRGRPVARPRDDREADRDQPRAARQSGQADRRVHAVRPVRRRQDRDRAGARRSALRRRAEHHHHQHVGVPGGAHGLDPEGRTARLCRIWRGRAAHRGGAAASPTA